ncbi:hypothetical protein [Nonomuraea sp. NPDC049158]|uniref:hypothetical protein n=1 Tax=Nonomuraea sp. NPDC049158 TaxID=3155649 RepID=UPI003409BC46
MNDQDVLDALKDSMPGVRMNTPVGDIVAAGRSRRRLKVTGLATGTALVSALALTLATGGPSVNAPPVVGGSVHVRLAAFSVDSNADGTVTVSMTKRQTQDPEVLERTLAEAGVPALIKINEFCDSPVDVPGFDDVWKEGPRRPDGEPTFIITPSAMPAGTKVLISLRTPDYKPESGSKLGGMFGLVRTDAPLRCTTDIPTPTTAVPTK